MSIHAQEEFPAMGDEYKWEDSFWKFLYHLQSPANLVLTADPRALLYHQRFLMDILMISIASL